MFLGGRQSRSNLLGILGNRERNDMMLTGLSDWSLYQSVVFSPGDNTILEYNHLLTTINTKHKLFTDTADHSIAFLPFVRP